MSPVPSRDTPDINFELTILMTTSILQTLLGLVIFYIGLKMFSEGMKSMGKLEHLEYFIHNPYWMFLGGIVCTLLWQSSSLSTTAIVGLVVSGALPLPSAIACILGANVGTTGTIWLAGIMVFGRSIKRC